MFSLLPLLVSAPLLISAHSHGSQNALADHEPVDISQEPWTEKYGAQVDTQYSGFLSFSHLAYAKCLEDASQAFDIAVIGFPFDTTTSYRPGARFGPFAIRSGSRRQTQNGYTLPWGASPSDLGAMMVDCGDVRDPYSKLEVC